MIIPYHWLGASAPPRRRPASRAEIQVERLEGRALLSKGPGYGIGEARLTANYGESVPAQPHPGPIHNIVGNGYAIKSARFYAAYEGQRLAQYNVASSIAVAPGDGTLQLNGQVVLPIPLPPAPTTPPPKTGKQPHPVPTPPPIVPSYYMWAINRGGASSLGPIPGRPDVTFDAAVIVAVEQSGITAFVTTLKGGAPVQLPSSDVSVNGFTVRASVPLNLLPATGGATDPSQYTVNFSAWNANPLTTDSRSLASMVPEFRNFHVRDAKTLLNPGPVNA